jgi:parallel beta-helix repeat protein
MYSNIHAGVFFHRSDNNTMYNCHIFNNHKSIDIGYSENNTIHNCNIQSNNYSISIFSSNNIKISQSNISNHNKNGIQLDTSTNCTIFNNNLSSDGIIISSSSLLHWNSHKIENNTIDNRPIRYYKNMDDFVIPEDTSQIILANCSNVTMKNLTINNVESGIHIGFSSHNIISFNSLNSNKFGIYLKSSCNNTIVGNNISDSLHGIQQVNSIENIIKGNTFLINIHGIYSYSSSSYISNNSFEGQDDHCIELHKSHGTTIISNTINNSSASGITLKSGSSHNIIAENTISNNGMGLYIRSSNNTIYHNNFIKNEYGHASDIKTNSWNNTYPSGGNYWDDYNGTDDDGDGIGDIPYNISDGSNQDFYPFMEPNGWKETYIVYVDDDFNENTSGWQITHFDKIQDGIDAVIESRTVYVYNGTYYENIAINKTINLIGEDRNKTIIDANGVGDVIEINSNNVTINGLTLQNSGHRWGNAGIDIRSSYNTIVGNRISNNQDGIFFGESSRNNIIYNIISNNKGGIYFEWDSSNNNIIKGNKIISSFYSGIKLYGSSNNTVAYNYVNSNGATGITLSYSCYNNTIIGNNISNNWDGIALWISSNNIIIGNNIYSNKDAGIDLNTHCKNNSITGNIITSNHHHGIWLDHDSINNTITGNDITSNNNWGIIFYLSIGNICSGNHISNNPIGIQSKYNSNNIINDNNITSNIYAGISLVDSSSNNITGNNICSNNYYGMELDSSSSNNNVFHNNFIENYYNAFDAGNNTWDGGKYGNYWDDYTGNDTDGDCIGDTSYLILGGNNTDRYPVMYPNGWINQPPKKPTVSGPIKGKPGVKYTYTAVTADPNCDNISYLWSWGDDSYSSWLGPYKSGEKVIASHTWSKGTYNITVKAKDTSGLESKWSESLVITMPRDKTNNNIFLRFLEKYPVLYQMLQLILQRIGLYN